MNDAVKIDPLAESVKVRIDPLGDSVKAINSRDRGKIAQFIMSHKSIAGAAYYLKEFGSRALGGPRLSDWFNKAAVPAMGTANTSQLVDRVEATGLVDAIVNAGAFDTIAASAFPAVLSYGQVGTVNVTGTAYAVDEGNLKKITSASIALGTYDPQKAHGVYIVTQELSRSVFSGANILVDRALQKIVALKTDVVFFASLLNGLSGATSTGDDEESVRSDIKYLLDQISGSGSDSKFFIVTTPAIAKAWHSMFDGQYFKATPTGGSLGDIPVLVTSGLTAGQVVMVDATGLACNIGKAFLENFDQGTVVMDDSAPDSPPLASTTIESLWQSNKTAITVERFFVGKKFRLTPSR